MLHNQLFYFDPGIGRLEFVPNDMNGHGMHNYPPTWRQFVRPNRPDFRSPLNERLHPLLDVALRDPRFLHARNARLYAALTGTASSENQVGLIESLSAAMDADVKADRYKAAIRDSFAGMLRTPYSNGQYKEAKAHMVDWVRGRNAFLLERLADARVSITLARQPRNGKTYFVVESGGNAAVNVDFAALGGLVAADRDRDGIVSEAVDPTTRLYPGLREDREFSYDYWFYVRRYPEYYLFPDTQRYLFAAEADPRIVAEALSGAITNALSGAPVEPSLKWVDDIDPATIEYNRISLHPWRFPPDPQGEIVVGPGTVALSEDLIVGPRQRLVVRPGTDLRLGPGVSIVSRGRAEIVGTADRPISIGRSRPDVPWGAIAIQGPAARDSRIAFAEVAGGSMDHLSNVQYSGMVNVHWADGFRMENSAISSNTGSDDTLHVVNSTFAISNLALRDCNADCIDLDYANGTLEDVAIRNAGNDGIDFMTSTVALRGIRVEGAGDKGLSIGEGSRVKAAAGAVRGAELGIAIKDRSTLVLSDWRLSDNKVGIDVYRKNWRYGGSGSAEVNDTAFLRNGVDLRVDKDGVVTLGGIDGMPTRDGAGTIRREAGPAR